MMQIHHFCASVKPETLSVHTDSVGDHESLLVFHILIVTDVFEISVNWYPFDLSLIYYQGYFIC